MQPHVTASPRAGRPQPMTVTSLPWRRPGGLWSNLLQARAIRLRGLGRARMGVRTQTFGGRRSRGRAFHPQPYHSCEPALFRRFRGVGRQPGAQCTAPRFEEVIARACELCRIRRLRDLGRALQFRRDDSGRRAVDLRMTSSVGSTRLRGDTSPPFRASISMVMASPPSWFFGCAIVVSVGSQ